MDTLCQIPFATRTKDGPVYLGAAAPRKVWQGSEDRRSASGWRACRWRQSHDIPKKVNKGTAASVKARQWKAGWRMVQKEKNNTDG